MTDGDGKIYEQSIAVYCDIVDVCIHAFAGISNLTDSEKQALIAVKTLLYIDERAKEQIRLLKALPPA